MMFYTAVRTENKITYIIRYDTYNIILLSYRALDYHVVLYIHIGVRLYATRDYVLCLLVVIYIYHDNIIIYKQSLPSDTPEKRNDFSFSGGRRPYTYMHRCRISRTYIPRMGEKFAFVSFKGFPRNVMENFAGIGG